jgi:hypothetical protein
MQRLLAAAVAFSLAGVPSSASNPHWTRVTTERFVVSGDAPAAGGTVPPPSGSDHRLFT